MMNTGASKDEQQPLHCGKWTPEEEAYVQCLIEEFQAGFLPIREGTSLRNFLSKMLNCKPKRISKKFEGSDYNGKQVYASQPYKLTAEQARERRDRLCSLEQKFHQSVAELKSVEGLKQQQQHQQLPGSGMGLSSSHGMDGSMNSHINPDMNNSGTSLSLVNVNNNAGGGGMSSYDAMNQMSNSSGMHLSANNPGGAGGNNQYLEELAFQESMLRLRQQQQQQMQMQQQQTAGGNSGMGGVGGAGGDGSMMMGSPNLPGVGGGPGGNMGGTSGNPTSSSSNSSNNNNSGSYVDPFLAMGQNTMNTTPMMGAASQFWRRQALLDASSHMDSLRMAQSGAIGIQRPTSLEPGGMRDLRVPSNLMNNNNNNNNTGMGGMNMNNMPDDFHPRQQQQQHSMEGGGGKDVDGGMMFPKKRPVDSSNIHSNSADDMVKRIRRNQDVGGQQHQLQQQLQQQQQRQANFFNNSNNN